MEKIHTSVEKVIRECVTFIANETDYDLDLMLRLTSRFVHKDDAPAQRCEAIVLKGNRCTNPAVGGSFCKKHVHFDAVIPHVRMQCTAITSSGQRCVHDVKVAQTGDEHIDDVLCGIHRVKRVRDERRAACVPCMYYDETDDSMVFCNRSTIDNQWCCTTHRHLHANYCVAFKYANLQEYIRAKTNGAPLHKVLEIRLGS
jgi:hypothetical protein